MPLYRAVGAGLVRAAVQAPSPLPGWWPGLDDDAQVKQWRAWLAQVWANRPVAEAVTAASPVLGAAIGAVCAGGRAPRPKQVRRMVLSLARYLVRMQGRATPFGLFAGVAPLRLGAPASIWDAAGGVVARADAVWLAEVTARLEADPAVLRDVPVLTNDLVFVRGERLVVPWQPHGGPGNGTAAEMSVRYTPPVALALRLARSALPAGELAEKIAAEFPGSGSATVENLVTGLVRCGALISGLRAPSTVTDGLGHLLNRVDGLHGPVPETATALVGELRVIHERLRASDRAKLGATATATASAGADTVTRMRKVADGDRPPIAVDLRLGYTVTLPQQVADEAAAAAGALLRLTPHPAGHPAWRDYHARFADRYGVDAVVPLLQLVDPVTGLGYPAHFAEGDAQQARPAVVSPRVERLLALAQQAALDRAREVAVDDDFLNQVFGEGLSAGSPAGAWPHAQVCAQVLAPTLAAIDGGAFTLLVTGIGRSGTALTGRFFDVLPGRERAGMLAAAAALPVAVDGAVLAHLSFPARFPRAENVTRVPALTRDVLTVAEHDADHAGDHAGDRSGRDGLRVEDLAVTADATGLYLLSLSRRRVVEPMLPNAAARQVMPPLVRLLYELPHARMAALSPMAWGLAGRCLPFLPRIRYGRSVLAPARWRLPAGALPGPTTSTQAWNDALHRLRDRLGLPGAVAVGAGDQQLRLSLDDPRDLAVLRAHLDSTDDATVAEALADDGWLDGHAHEIVIPLAVDTPPAPAPAAVTAPGPIRLIDPRDDVLPGGTVLFASLYGAPQTVDTILLAHLPDLLAEWDEPPVWWFVRYRDPAPHLRLRLRVTDPDEYGAAAARVGRWVAGLRRLGLIGELSLDTYRPEIARYGAGAAVTAAEDLFAADSAAALAQIHAAASRAVDADAALAASMVDLVCAMAGGCAAGMDWLIGRPHRGGAGPLDRAVVAEAVTLAGAPGETPFAAAWSARRRAATAYTDRLAAEPARRLTAAAVTPSLLHMHHIRAHGIDRDHERLLTRTARAVALAATARRNREDNQR
ncbi:lantibiotic dehydratase [Actinomadura napierensis]|uniref:Lantibiotic dehydratase n=2 Tax=Actinomadura napierensis TaxID=267854 RepID=A0ABP5LP82_9ACTN